LFVAVLFSMLYVYRRKVGRLKEEKNIKDGAEADGSDKNDGKE